MYASELPPCAPLNIGPFQPKLRALYLDESGRYKSHILEPAIVVVRVPRLKDHPYEQFLK